MIGTLILIAVISQKAVYSQLPDNSNFRTLGSPVNGQNNYLYSNNGIPIKNGLTNGVDVNLQSLNNQIGRDIIKHSSPLPTVSSDDSISRNSQGGLTVDWPSNLPYFQNHLLHKYFPMIPDSQYLVHIPDYILLPRDSDMYYPDQGLVDFHFSDFQHSQGTERGDAFPVAPLNQNIQNSPPIVEGMVHNSHSLETLATQPGQQSATFAHDHHKSKGQIQSTPTNADFADPSFIKNGNTFTFHSGDVLNINSDIPTHEIQADTQTDVTNAHSGPWPSVSDVMVSGNPQQESLKPLKVIIDTKPNSPIHFTSDHHINTKAPTKVESLIRRSAELGNGVQIASPDQTKQLVRTRLPPLRDIFAGDSLYKKRPKVIKVFHLSPKQEALWNFEG